MIETKAKEKSELSLLLDKNAIPGKELSAEERARAEELIRNPEYSGRNCWFCEYGNHVNPIIKVNKAIYDIGLCVPCASYALHTGK